MVTVAVVYGESGAPELVLCDPGKESAGAALVHGRPRRHTRPRRAVGGAPVCVDCLLGEHRGWGVDWTWRLSIAAPAVRATHGCRHRSSGTDVGVVAGDVRVDVLGEPLADAPLTPMLRRRRCCSRLGTEPVQRCRTVTAGLGDRLIVSARQRCFDGDPLS